MTDAKRYFKELRMQQLRALVELARGKGFAGTATALGLSTPSVWQQIRGLEEVFGETLVSVQGLRVSLTPRGRELVDLATPLVEGFDSLRDRFAAGPDAAPRRLRVAAPNSVLVHELPEPIRRYREAAPEVELTLIDCPSNAGRRLLEEDEVDLAVVGLLDADFPATLTADDLTSYPFMLVLPANHPLTNRRRIRPEDIVQYPLVMPGPGTNSRRRTDEVFAAAGLRESCRIVCTASTKELLIQYVQLGFGIGVVSISARFLAGGERGPHPASVEERGPHPSGLAFRDLSDRFGRERIVILRRTVRPEPPHRRLFREIATSYAAEPSTAPSEPPNQIDT